MCSKYFLAALLTLCLPSPSLVNADGNITATVSSGNLRLVGESRVIQGVRITPTSVRNRYKLEGLSGTTVNRINPCYMDGVTSDIEVNMYSSRSTVIVSNDVSSTIQIPGNLKIYSDASEATAISLNKVFCYKNLSITTRYGKDAVVVRDCTFKWSTDVRLGKGDDVFYSRATVTTDMWVDGSVGNDYLLVEGNQCTRSTFLSGGSGDDQVAARFPYPTEFHTMDGGFGFDQFLFEGPASALTTFDMESPHPPGSFAVIFTMAVALHDPFRLAISLW